MRRLLGTFELMMSAGKVINTSSSARTSDRRRPPGHFVPIEVHNRIFDNNFGRACSRYVTYYA